MEQRGCVINDESSSRNHPGASSQPLHSEGKKMLENLEMKPSPLTEFRRQQNEIRALLREGKAQDLLMSPTGI